MDDITRRRLEHNEAVFKSVNAEIDGRTEDRRSLDYVCECADTTCTSSIRLTHEEYARVRREPDRYVVLPGHVVPELEDVVGHERGYVVVAKR